MPSLDAYRNRAKRLVRWHRDANYSVGAKVRLLDRYRDLTDRDVLEMPLPLTLAQEIVAVEAGYPNWAALRTGVAHQSASRTPPSTPAELTTVIPILFVRDVAAAAGWWGRVGFEVDFLHGSPPFYASVSRDGVCLHLRHVHEPNFTELARHEDSLILATIEVTDVKTLFDELQTRDIDIAQRLTRQAWGGLDFHIRDPDGNTVSFVQYLPA